MKSILTNLYLISVLGVSLVCDSGFAQDDVLVVGREGNRCAEDIACFNRMHPDIPMTAQAEPGQVIVFRTRNAGDSHLDPNSAYRDDRGEPPYVGAVHPLTGPIYINGAKSGDVLGVTILNIDPGEFGFTRVTGSGFVSDQIQGSIGALWRLNRLEAISADIPGIRIPNASFPGIVTVLPGPDQHSVMLAREEALALQGGDVRLPSATHAVPRKICGPEGTKAKECLRTGPPREHGGNMDIRYLGVGVTVYLPCYIEGCGLALGDLHFAQGDGEVSGTAIEMDADVMVTTRVIKDGPELTRGPHYEGILQEPALLEVGQEAGHWFVDLAAVANHACLHVAVVIPAGPANLHAVHQHGVAHAALNHAPGQEALAAKSCGCPVVHAVQFMYVRGLP